LAIVVLFSHVNQIMVAPYNNFLSGIFGILSSWAVLAFFVISGYSIRNSVIGNINKNNKFVIINYFYSRLNRLYPPLILSILLSLFLWVISPYFFASDSRTFLITEGKLARIEYTFDIFSLVGSSLFLNGFYTNTFNLNGPLWSLSYEFWYYVIAALLCVSKFKHVSTVIAFLLFAVLSYKNKVFMLYGLIWFCSFYYVELYRLHKFIVERKLIRFSILLFSALYFAVYISYFSFFQMNEYLNPTKFVERIIILSNMFFGLFFLYKLMDLKLSINDMPKSDYFKYSYTLYIIHFPILLFIYGATQKILSENNNYIPLVGVISAVSIIYLSGVFGSFVETVKPLKRDC